MMRWDDEGETDHVENPFGAAVHFHDDEEDDGAEGPSWGSGGGGGGGHAYGTTVPLHHHHHHDAAPPRTPAGGQRRRTPSRPSSSSPYYGAGGPTPYPSTDRTPLFGGGGGYTSGGVGYSPSVAALRASRGRERRRLLGRLAVGATRPGALAVLAAVALVFGVVQWRSVPSDAEMASLTDQPAMTATLNGQKVMIVQPSNLQKRPIKPPPPAPWEGIVPEQLPKPEKKNKKRRMEEPRQQQQAEPAMGRSRKAQGSDAAEPAADADLGLVGKLKNVAFGQKNKKKQKGFKPKPIGKGPAAKDAGVVWIKDKHGKKTVVLLPKPKKRMEEQEQEEEARMESTKNGKRHGKKDVPEADGIVRPAVLTEAAEEDAAPYGKTDKKTNGKKKNDGGSAEHHSAWEFYVPPLGGTEEGSSSGNGADVVTYYYDPPMGSTSSGSVVEPELAYDADGNPVPVADLHGEGRNDVFLVPPPPHPHPEDGAAQDEEGSETSNNASASSSTTSRNAKAVSSSAESSSADGAAPTKDQLIIVATVATLALLVGALSARRLRSRQFLNSCIENESLEDELAYDAAHTHTGSLLGAGAAGYDTFASGNIKWRGDLEKFDV